MSSATPVVQNTMPGPARTDEKAMPYYVPGRLEQPTAKNTQYPETLTLAGALAIADEIRTAPRGFPVDRDLWPWAIEQLVKRLEAVEELAALQKKIVPLQKKVADLEKKAADFEKLMEKAATN